MTEDQYTAVERYADGHMSGQERADMEAALAKDPALADALAQYRQMKKALELAAFEAQKKKVRALDQRQASRKVPVLLKVAAMVALVFIPYLIFRTSDPDPAALAMDYFTPYPDRITVLGTASDDLQAAMDAYNAQDYATALSRLEQAEPSGLVALYQSVCYLGLDSCAQATQSLAQLTQEASAVREAAQWYAILAHLRCGQTDRARELLDAYLADSTNRFSRTQAKSLLMALSEV
ncbi:MAG: hypothetical protein AAGB22_06780 [Bacteroidota bacterium]